MTTAFIPGRKDGSGRRLFDAVSRTVQPTGGAVGNLVKAVRTARRAGLGVVGDIVMAMAAMSDAAREPIRRERPLNS